MKALLRLAMRVYPSWWRRRYAREFDALLEQLQPGWFELADVFTGALAMRIRTLGSIPAACALSGGLIGGIVAMKAPVMYASSATIRVAPHASGNTEDRTRRDLLPSLESALGPSTESKRATRVMVLASNDGSGSTLRLTYRHRNPAEAHRITQRLATALTTALTASTIVEAPQVPVSPVSPAPVVSISLGAAFGLVAGTCGLVLVRTRRRRSPSPRQFVVRRRW